MMCDRCHREVHAHIMSKFNRDDLCLDCKNDERECPNYAAADLAEFKAVKGGDLNFPGIGLAPEDRAFLQNRLTERSKQAVIPFKW
jgi:hypothetical protein